MTTAFAAPQNDPIGIYVDTNIVHYLSTGRGPKAVAANNALAALATSMAAGRVTCYASTLALAEEYDGEKAVALVLREMRNGNVQRTNAGLAYRNREDVHPLNPRVRANSLRAFITGLGATAIRRKDPNVWPANMVEILCRTTDLQWPDAVHLALALSLRCDYLVTNDGPLAEQAAFGLATSRRVLHKRIAQILQSELGLPPQRTRAPLIRVLLLRDPQTAPLINSL